MIDRTRSALRDFTLKARTRLIAEVRELLADGPDGTDGRDRMVRETAFTWLHQVVARRMLGRDPMPDMATLATLPSLGAGGAPLAGPLSPRLSPRPGTLAELDRLLLLAPLREAFLPGQEETLGWVYQFFNEPEKAEVFDRLFKKKQKIRSEDIAVATQLFTPRWIVRMLLENTLGRLWLELHPDSRLRPALTYLVPLAGGPAPAEVAPSGRRAAEITLLDPACGTMHFGLVAFDLLAAMYREELDRAGTPGWPGPPSVALVEDIPAAIFSRNLFGIDIDPWAVRLAALTLHLKARELCPDPPFPALTSGNLLCADVLRMDPGPGPGAQRRYDVVVANPPYMTRRNMNPALQEFLRARFPRSKGDLYAAFLEHCTGFLTERGRLGMITQQSFMFTSSYQALRRRLLDAHVIEAMCHLGPRAFAEVAGEKVNTTAFVLRREDDPGARAQAVGTYLRLVAAPDPPAKQAAFESALRGLPAGPVFRSRQGDFEALPQAPWVYWITDGLRARFAALPRLGERCRPRQGLATADNFRFLRFSWEVGPGRIAFGCEGAEAALASGKRWFPYMKGGGFRRWWGNQEYVVNWAGDGAEIKAHICATYPYLNGRWEWVAKNAEFYFRPGVTYSYLSSGRFSARLSPGGFLFDVAGSSLFPEDPLLLLAVMNSRFAAGALRLLNPTVNFQVGDLARLPLPRETSPVLRGLVQQAIALCQADSAEDELSWDFVAPPTLGTGVEERAARAGHLRRLEAEIDREVARLYGLGPEDQRVIDGDGGDGDGGGGGSGDGNGNGDGNGDRSRGRNRGRDRDRDRPADLARRWVSYAVGLSLGRFRPDSGDGPGGGRFPMVVRERLALLREPGGVLVLEPGHPLDLAARVMAVLEVVLGEAGAGQAALLAAGGPGPEGLPEEALRRYLCRGFFAHHRQHYSKRPVYWLLQSPGKCFSAWLHHERASDETLRRIRQELLLPAMARHRRAADDLSEFCRRLDQVLARGYRYHPDDGVLLNLAPLHELCPWPGDLAEAWQALCRGDFDWSRQAMDRFPERVRDRCLKDPSYALAHR